MTSPRPKPFEPAAASKPRPVQRPPQFTIFGLMVLTFVVSMAMAPVFYMVQAMQGDTSSRAVTVLMSVGMPMLLMVLLSIGLQVRRWLQRRR